MTFGTSSTLQSVLLIWFIYFIGVYTIFFIWHRQVFPISEMCSEVCLEFRPISLWKLYSGIYLAIHYFCKLLLSLRLKLNILDRKQHMAIWWQSFKEFWTHIILRQIGWKLRTNFQSPFPPTCRCVFLTLQHLSDPPICPPLSTGGCLWCSQTLTVSSS